jgi:hypothetical protein
MYLWDIGGVKACASCWKRAIGENAAVKRFVDTLLGETKTSSAAVNKALVAAGFSEHILQGRGYVYFDGGHASAWYTSSVPVCWISHLPVEDYVEMCRQYHAEYAQSHPDVPATCDGTDRYEYTPTAYRNPLIRR